MGINKMVNGLKQTKRVLIVASTASMIDQFNRQNIKLLQELGYEVDVATNFKEPGTITEERSKELVRFLEDSSVDCYQIDFDRKITNVKAIFKAMLQLDSVFRGKREAVNKKSHKVYCAYTFMHCHSPIGAAVGRVVAKKNHVKTIYTAHGFHFFTGAPKKNWILYYPVEKILANLTDVLVTINTEDYKRAEKKLHAKKMYYVPGIGIDLDKFKGVSINREEKRRELGVTDQEVLLLSIGELNENKNHKIVIDAIEKVKDFRIRYMIAGKGKEADNLRRKANEEDVNLTLLGFRTDIAELLYASDIFVLPSIREGLNVSLMEAMASSLPCICSDIRGNQDLIEDSGGIRVNPYDIDGFANAIHKMINEDTEKYGEFNADKIQNFSLVTVNELMKKIYKEM